MSAFEEKNIQYDCNIIAIPSKTFIKQSNSNGRSFYLFFLMSIWGFDVFFRESLNLQAPKLNWEKSRKGLNAQLYTLHSQLTNFLWNRNDEPHGNLY